MHMKYLEEDDIINDWLDTLAGKPNTVRSYLFAMQQYTDYTGKNPETILKEAEEDIRAGKLMRERQVKKQLVGFRKYLENKGYSPNTINNQMAGVKSFYRIFDIDLPTLPGKTQKARPEKKRMQIPTKDEIREVLKVCDLREKAIILVGLSSGLSANEIRNLKLKDFYNGYDSETEITTLDLRREKVGFDFITFLTPEASRAVRDYLAYRDREITTGPKLRIKQIKKQNTQGDDGYLFIARCIPEEFVKTGNEECRRLTKNAMLKIYQNVAKKAGNVEPAGEWNKIRSHNMRKMFNSALVNAGCDNFYVEYWMGHTLNDTQSAYFRANPEQMKEKYRQYVPYLTIQKELDVSESPEYQEVKKQNEVLQAETARHVVERSEMAEMKKQMEAMQEILFTDPEMVKRIKNKNKNK